MIAGTSRAGHFAGNGATGCPETPGDYYATKETCQGSGGKVAGRLNAVVFLSGGAYDPCILCRAAGKPTATGPRRAALQKGSLSWQVCSGRG